MKTSITVLLLPFILSITLYAQASEVFEDRVGQKEDTAEKTSEQTERMRKILEGLHNSKADPPILPDASNLALLDDSTKEKFFMAMREYYDYRISGYKHRAKVFDWQLASSRVIFVVVVLLVMAGVYFSWVQFRSAFPVNRMPNPGQEKGITESSPAANLEVTQFVASIEGIKVSSPVLGVIILVISLAFFYLYLAYVYPVHEVL